MKSRESLVVALIVGASRLPLVSSAMEIPQFDRMAAEDRQHYVAFLVKEAQKLLTEQGEGELALKVHQLFKDIPPGKDRSVGETSFETELAAARDFATKSNLQGKVSWNEVDFVLFQTLLKNGIKPSAAFFKTFPQVTRNRVFYQEPK